MKDVSVIITSRNEYPLNFMTVFSLVEELKGSGYDWEIVVVDNFPDEGDDTRNVYDITYAGVPKDVDGCIRYVNCTDKAGHWAAKNAGIAAAEGRMLFFPDAHTVMSKNGLVNMIAWLDGFSGGNIGGLHAFARFPISGDWNFKDWQILGDQWTHEYKNITTPRQQPEVVNTASTCGMLCRKDVFDALGGWNPNFGVRGGGETYLVWKHITCGYPHYIHHSSYFWHPFLRSWPYPVPVGDTIHNTMLSAFCVGGTKWLDAVKSQKQFVLDTLPAHDAAKGLDLEAMKADVIATCAADRAFIEARQTKTIDQHFTASGVDVSAILEK